MPDTIDERFLELALFSMGMAVFFKDEVMGYLALRTTQLSGLHFKNHLVYILLDFGGLKNLICMG